MAVSTVTVNTKHLDSIQIDRIADLVLESYATATKDEILDNWSPRAPSQPYKAPAVRTGRLKRSVGTSRQSADEHYVNVGAFYARFLEYGTRKMLPRPFVLPAFHRAVENVDVKTIMRNALK